MDTHTADVLPTFAYLAGGDARLPADLDGQSFASLLQNVPFKPAARAPLYWEFHERGFQQAVRMGAWKAIRLKKDAPLELYNLSDDPGEQKDVAASHPKIVAQIELYLKTARTESERWPIK